jgi:sRNA-binding regulator protein Hfq
MYKYKKNYLIIFSKGKHSGYGHYKRSLLIEKYIKENITSSVKKICVDDVELKKKKLTEVILDKIKKKRFKILILDLNSLQLSKSLSKIKKFLISINNMGVKIVGVDSLRNFYQFLDHVWIPSPFKEKNLKGKNIFYGWSKMVFNRYQFEYKKKK